MNITACDASQVRIVTVQAQPSDQTESYLLRPWRDDPALRGPCFGLEHRSIGVQDPGLEPFADEIEKGAVVDPKTEHPQQPAVVDVLEEPADIGFHQVAELAGRQRHAEIAHRVLGAPARAVAMGAVEEVFLVDRPQELGTGQLHEFIFQRRDAQRPFFSVLFRYVDAPDEFRPVAPGFHALRQVGDVAFQIGCVSLRRQPIDATGRLLIQAVPAVHQQIGVHLVVEVAKAMVFALFCSISYCPQ